MADFLEAMIPTLLEEELRQSEFHEIAPFCLYMHPFILYDILRNRLNVSWFAVQILLKILTKHKYILNRDFDWVPRWPLWIIYDQTQDKYHKNHLQSGYQYLCSHFWENSDWVIGTTKRYCYCFLDITKNFPEISQLQKLHVNLQQLMRIKQFWCRWKEENHTFHQKQKMFKLNEKMENYIEIEFV